MDLEGDCAGNQTRCRPLKEAVTRGIQKERDPIKKKATRLERGKKGETKGASRAN